MRGDRIPEGGAERNIVRKNRTEGCPSPDNSFFFLIGNYVSYTEIYLLRKVRLQISNFLYTVIVSA